MRSAAAARGLEIEIRERPVARSLAEAAELLGLQPSDIVKTLVVKRSDDTYLFALVPGGRSISWPKLRALVGVNKLRLPEAELALAATGYERGTIVPIGSTTDWPVYVDETIVGRRVAMGAGTHGYSLFVDADDLTRAYDATVADISVPE
ncbi:YbaK/EbsC family protein [Microbacterium sp. H1-D42]|uniref:aminoacyl-tRNA deacylase n=1 Tax=Microbacterium sp. H1-D42 TaxID=2925844 RepID=UPI001F532350|nr:YbaK/EbsC family protein [Microbacterium sp. H1-D42]UNK72635.1 YbaK/EbsC family protein [Microbacterium sp. H1-D42]